MIIITGAKGQLGTDVVRELKKRNVKHIGIDLAELDITDDDAVQSFFAAQQSGVTCVIHCAAYTAVDKAEDEQELCYAVNEKGTENLAKACRRINAEMIYISTDYVFDGGDEGNGNSGGTQPYETNGRKKSLSTYGKSKLAGEEAVKKHLEKYYIVRISWVFGHTGANFVKTVLRLAESRDELNVVGDQIGSPTYTPDLAKLLCDMALSGKYGEYHATNEGFCSWAELAAEIMRLREVSSGRHVQINPITTEEYPLKATRPKNSRLSKKSLDEAGFTRLPTWQDALKRFMAEERKTKA